MKGTKTVTEDVLGPETVQIDKWSWIGHAARAGRIVGHAVGHAVGCTARVVNEAKVGSVPKARGAVRARVAGAMKCANLECGHPSGRVVLQVPSWCPPRMRCPNSSSSRRKS